MATAAAAVAAAAPPPDGTAAGAGTAGAGLGLVPQDRRVHDEARGVSIVMAAAAAAAMMTSGTTIDVLAARQRLMAVVAPRLGAGLGAHRRSRGDAVIVLEMLVHRRSGIGTIQTVAGMPQTATRVIRGRAVDMSTEVQPLILPTALCARENQSLVSKRLYQGQRRRGRSPRLRVTRTCDVVAVETMLALHRAQPPPVMQMHGMPSVRRLG